MGKKQTRQNRGARTGGHERAASETKGSTESPAAREAMRPVPQETSHKQSRKFGHN